MSRRVVITGLGIISPVGESPAEFFDNLMAGRSGIRRLETGFANKLSSPVAAPVMGYNPADYFPKIRLSGIERFSQFALIAAEQAVKDAQLELTADEQPRAGVHIGTGMGGIGTIEECYAELFRSEGPRLKPLSVLLGMNNAAASHLSLTYRLQGPNVT